MAMIRLLCVCSISAMFMVSCALPPPVPDEVVTHKYTDSSKDEVFKKVNADYQTAQQQDLAFYAPDQFNKGREALSKAGQLSRNKAEDIEILKQLYIAEQQLNICRQVKMQAEQQMPEVLNALDALRAKSVRRSYAGEFDGLVYDASKLLRHIEDFVLGKPVATKQEVTKEKAKLLGKLQELEIKVVKYNVLNESKLVFREVDSLGGNRLAPKTFETAEKTLRDANAVIESNVKDEEAIAEVAKKYEFAVFHALHVTRAVDDLRSLSGSDYETYVIDLEGKLQAIAEALDYRDIRNHSLHEQIQLLAGLARRLMVQKANLAETSGGSIPDDVIEVNNLKERHVIAQQKIQELSDQLAQIQTNQASVAAASEEVQQLKSRAAILEEEVSRLVLQYNNLKVERDSLQNKLNAMVSKTGNSN